MTADAPIAPTVLVAEDDPALLEILTALLTESGYRAIPVANGQAAIDWLRTTPVDIVLTDIQMPDADGVAVLRAVREKDLDTPVILITGNPTVPTAVEALTLGAIGYLTKPVPAAELLHAVSKALSLVRLARLRREAVIELGGGPPHLNADRAGLESVFARAKTCLWMAYQPLIWARDGSLFGQEALLRTTTVEVPNPGVFLDIAERLGRMHDLGRQVRASISRDIASTSGAMLVNLHPLELSDSTLATGADPLLPFAERIILEITERASLDGVSELRDVVSLVRSRGFRIAIDDLGSGYAALSSFASLEPDVVKLDMSLVRGIDSNSTKRRLVGSIAELCRDLGILVVAEGIETKTERDIVTELGCDLLQGFLLGRPTALPATAGPA
jgi:EAL domain-containing protein (putative c-di-GMP-specific phosphodiesterase class I)